MNYLTFLKIILKNEGGYVNDPDDRGGETYRGISRRHHPHWIGWKYLDSRNTVKGEIYEDLEEIVELFYFGNYYTRIAGKELINIHPLLALHVFDFAVNAGVSKAVRMLQKIASVDQDGIIGPITLAGLKRDPEMMYIKFYSSRIIFYREIATIDNNRKFLSGWLRRIRDCSKAFYKEVMK